MTQGRFSAEGTSAKRRVLVGYVVLLGLAGIVIALSLRLGDSQQQPPAVAGAYESSNASACLSEGFEIAQSGTYLNLLAERGNGSLRIDGGSSIVGDVRCADGSEIPVDVSVVEGIDGVTLEGTLTATLIERLTPADSAAGKSGESVEEIGRSGEELFGRLMLALASVILAARLLGSLVSRIGQPRVMGEVLAGILLGPTLVGTIAPGITDFLFPPDVIPLLGAGADIGLAFYMFLVGLELDPTMLKGRVEQAAFISHGSIAIPMAFGIATAVPLYGALGPADKDFLPFAVFMGVSMSITAFPVLARILLERRMFRSSVGAMAIGAAAVDDVSAWGLLAFATAIAGTGSGLGVFRIVILAIVFCAAMALIARPFLARVSDAYDEAGHIPSGWITTIFVGVLISAFVSQQIGIAAIFGAFVMGLIMPRRADLTHEVTKRLEDFIVTVLLPLFFVVTGLKTRVGLIDRPELWAITVGLVGVAVACKWLGAMGTARFTGFAWRESSVIGALMNTRGLTELIVLTIGLELGVITPLLFTMLVIMALVTTFMTGPALSLLDPRGEFSVPPEEFLRPVGEAAEPPAQRLRAILVAPQDGKNIGGLISIAEPLARSKPEREVLLTHVVTPSRTATGVAAEERQLAEASKEVEERRRDLMGRNVAARAVAFTSPEPGRDTIRLASQDEIDLVLVDGRRPLIGGGVPRGDVGMILAEAPCDVAVLVDRSGTPVFDEHHPVVVPFGGAEHDWAALELGAWISFVEGAPLTLLGRQGDVIEGQRDASRLLANASLVVQQLAGVAARPVLAPPGREGIIAAARGAGLLVIGLSDLWREEGLGAVRADIAKAAPAPILFVRRGRRAGALAPQDDVTRFAWSTAGPPPVR